MFLENEVSKEFFIFIAGKQLVVIVAVVVVLGCLVIGIVIFLSCRYCRKKRNSLAPQLRRGSDLIDGGLKRISTLGSRYTGIPSSSEDKDNITTSLTIPTDSDNVSTFTTSYKNI